MNCDEVELALVTGDGLSNEAKEHIAGCGRCAAFQIDAAQVMADAALPALSASEKASLAGLAPRVHHAWKQKERRGGVVRRFMGLAIAACMGAAVASAALLPGRVTHAQLPQTSASDQGTEWALPGFELPAADADDELDFEVGWPTTADTN